MVNSLIIEQKRLKLSTFCWKQTGGWPPSFAQELYFSQDPHPLCLNYAVSMSMFISKPCDNSPKAINILAKEKSGLQNCAKGVAERQHGRALHPQPAGSSTPSGPGSRWLSQPYCPLWISSTWSGISPPAPATSWKLVNCFSNASCLEEFTALSQTLWLRKI